MLAITPKILNSELPGQVKVGPITYKIVMTPKPMAPREGEEDVPVFGMVNFKTATITIDTELAPSMQWQCYFHELMHIVFVTLGLEDPGEGQDDAFAYLFMDYLIDNGFLVEIAMPEDSSTPLFPITHE